MVCETLLTTRVCDTSAAALYCSLPSCEAVMTVLPRPTMETMFPLIVATSGFELVYLTGRPLLAMAPGSKSASPRRFSGMAPKLIVWSCLTAVTLQKSLAVLVPSAVRVMRHATPLPAFSGAVTRTTTVCVPPPGSEKLVPGLRIVALQPGWSAETVSDTV
jgi:hypothetical protein